MSPFLIYVNVTFKSYLVLCKCLMLWTLEQVTQFLITILWCVSYHSHRENALAGTIGVKVPDSLTEESQNISGYAVLSVFWLETENGMCGLLIFFLSFLLRSCLNCSRGARAGSVSKRPKAVLQGRVMLAQHLPGMLAPSAQAENFASANCDFRTQVCSWTWTPSCQCVAICH